MRQTEMKLADYTSDNYYFDFDLNSGKYARLKLSSARKDFGNFSGMGQILRSPRAGKVLVASYAYDDDAWIAIGNEKWKLFDQCYVIKHEETLAGFICVLSILKDDQCVKKFTYFRRDWMMLFDPTYDHMDFWLANLPVNFVHSESISIQKQREDFIRTWTKNAHN
ncbi:hypothetical protein [Undibacterium macrobrachii]|nr:hypothetical protein [Undibacterium macrobrachii]